MGDGPDGQRPQSGPGRAEESLCGAAARPRPPPPPPRSADSTARPSDMRIRVEASETGQVFTIRREHSIDQLKYELSLLTPTAPQDQIILFGPPFKILDSQYHPEMTLEGKRIFLFDRKMLSTDNPYIPPTQLPPKHIAHSDMTGVNLVDTRRLPRRLLERETFFRTLLSRSLCTEAFVRESVVSSRRCLNQHRVQLDAIDAAIQNLKDNFFSVMRSYEQLECKFLEQQRVHQELLDNFEQRLDGLKAVDLDPAIAAAIALHLMASTSHSSATPAPAVSVKTLYDCIPVERELAFFNQGRDAQRLASDTYSRIKALRDALMKAMATLVPPFVDFVKAQSAIASIEEEQSQQVVTATSLREHYRAAYEIISSIGHPSAEEEIASATAALEERQAQLSEMTIVAQLERGVERVQQEKTILEQSHTELTRLVYATMRRVAAVQTDMQFKLKRDMDWMRKWATGRNEYIGHLQQLVLLPTTYEQYLVEIRRRRGYNVMFKAELLAIVDHVNKLRLEETGRREIFMQQHGVGLPPVFVDAVRSLRDKPPFFTPVTSALEELPVVLDSPADEGVAVVVLGEETAELRCSRLEYENLLLRQRLARVDPQVEQEATPVRKGTKEVRTGLNCAEQTSDPTHSTAQVPTEREAQLAAQLMAAQAAAEREAQLAERETQLTAQLAAAQAAEREAQLAAAQLAERETQLTAQLAAAQAAEREAQLAAAQLAEREAQLAAQLAAEREAQLVERETQLAAQAAAAQAAVVQAAAAQAAERETQLAAQAAVAQAAAAQLAERETQLAAQAAAAQAAAQAAQAAEREAQLTAQLAAAQQVVQQVAEREAQLTAQLVLQCETLEASQRAMQTIRDLSTNLLGGLEPDALMESTEGDTASATLSVVKKLADVVAQHIKNPMLSIMDFKVGDIALFMPAQSGVGMCWMAFNSGSPHRILSEESVHAFASKRKSAEPRVSIIGRIVYIVRHVAGVDPSTIYERELDLPTGTEYFICDAKPLFKSGTKARAAK